MFLYKYSLPNQLNELCIRVRNDKLHIIAITEFKPKNLKYGLAESELQIQGYNMFYNSLEKDGTRGTILYFADNLNATQVNINDFKDHVWCKIRLNNKDQLLVGCMYKSPNIQKEQELQMLRAITEAASLKTTHMLIMVDYNYPQIDWSTWTTNSPNHDDRGYVFIENIRDNYLYQHVTKPTRARGEQKQNTIDLILTNEEGMVDTIEYISPIGVTTLFYVSFLIVIC